MPLGLQHTEKIEKIKQLGEQEKAALVNNTVMTDWEQPVLIGSMSLPPFPIKCLPPVIRNYVMSVSENTQTALDMGAVAALANMAACVQGQYKVQGKPDWLEPLNLYSVVIADPAERKSAVLGAMTKYINEYEYKANQELKPDIDKNRLEKKLLQKEVDRLTEATAKKPEYKEALMEKQEELTKFEDIKPLRLLADDISVEALTSLIADNNGKMALISSEGGIFETLQGRYSQGVNIDIFLKAHCGDPVKVDRKGRDSEYIKEPCLTVLLSIQPQVLEGLITNDVFRGRGLTGRFLYSIPTSPVGSRKQETEGIPHEHKENFRQLCFDLLDIDNKACEVLKLSGEAYILSVKFGTELEPRFIDDLEGIKDFAGKLHGAVLRIAGILHVVKQLVFAKNEQISGETMQEAIEIGNYFLEHAKAAYQMMGADEQTKEAKYILGKIQKQGLEKFSKNELMRICRKYKLVDELTAPLIVLEQLNYLRKNDVIQTSNNRSVETYLVNPAIYKT